MYRLKVTKPLHLHQMTIEPGSIIVIAHEGSMRDRVAAGNCELIKEEKRGRKTKATSKPNAMANSGAGR